MALGALLEIIGRRPEETCAILSQVPGGVGLSVDWTTVGEAEGVAGQYGGSRNVWFGVQPIKMPVKGRGKRGDVTGVRTLYADLDYKNMAPALALEMVEDLNLVLGVASSAIVASGGGLQPYWPVEEIDPVNGAMVLLWWREQVIKVAAARGVAVDTGVYDLSRILRVPGLPNMKEVYGPGGAKTGMVRIGCLPGGGTCARLSGEWIAGRIRMHPTGEPGHKATRVFTRSEPGMIGLREVSGDDRVFTPAQWRAYLYDNPGTLAILGRTEMGSGFNDALNKAAFDCAAGVPELWSEAEAVEALVTEIEKIFPGGPDQQDWSTIRSGFSQSSWSARKPTESESVDPFRAFANPVEIWEKQGRKVGTKGKAVAATQLQDRVGVEVDVDGPTFLTEEFWAARPVFGHLRRVAWAAMECPEGVFTAALALTIARVMPNVMLPAPVGVEASLNLMTVIAGDPADGKSVCRKLAERALSFEGDVDDVWRFNPSSGQGIAGQFQTLRKERGQPPEMARTRYRAIANVEESDTLQALAASPTSTLSSELRKGAMGEDLGFGNVGETQTNLKEHSYRLVLMMCLQPELGAWLLGDAQGGLPQRFLWCSVRDPRVIEGEEMPGKWPVVLPTEAKLDPLGGVPRPRFVMGCTNAIRDEIRTAKIERKLRGREAGVDFDGHAILTRFKVAGGLALMDGRLGINDEDWALGGAVMTMSNAARAIVQSAVAGAASRDNEKKAKGRGASRVIEEAIAREAVEETMMTRTRVRVLKVIGEQPGILRRALGQRLSNMQREYLSEVLDQLITEDRIRFEDRPQSSAWFLK